MADTKQKRETKQREKTYQVVTVGCDVCKSYVDKWDWIFNDLKVWLSCLVFIMTVCEMIKVRVKKVRKCVLFILSKTN